MRGFASSPVTGRIHTEVSRQVSASTSSPVWTTAPASRLRRRNRRTAEGYVHIGDVTPRVSARGHARLPMPPLVRGPVDTWHLIMKSGAVRTHPQDRAPAVAMVTEGEEICVPSYLSGSPWLRVCVGQPGNFRYGYLEAWHLEDLKLAADEPAAPSGTVSTGKHGGSHQLAVGHWSTVRDRAVVRAAART